MPQTLTWIVLADGSRGRILVQERLGSPLRRAFDEEDLIADDARRLCAFIAELVSRAALQRRFERLILVASPGMLGELRKGLTPHARALVRTEVAKNWLRLTDDEVKANLGEALLSPLATSLASEY